MTYLSRLPVSCLSVFFVCFYFNSVIAQNWVQKNEGMYGAKAHDLLVMGDTIFMATEFYGDEMYISTDNGFTWEGFPQPDLEFPTSFTLKQDTIFVASRKGVSYSVDNGLTWVLYNEGMGPAQISS